MVGFELSAGVNADNVFLVKFAELQGRLDPLFYNTVHGFSLVKTIYPVKKLSEVINMQRGRFGHRPRNDPKFYDGQYPFIQTGDVVKASKTNESIAYTQTLNELGLKTSRLFDENVLVITIAANIGDTAILDYPACFPDSLIGITPKTDALTLNYLNVYFKFLKPYLEDLAPQSAQKNINYQQLSPVPIVIPPLAIQQKISDLFHQAHNQKQQKEQKAQALLDSIDGYLLNALGITLPVQDNSLEKRMFTVPFSKVTGGRIDPVSFSSFGEYLFSSIYGYKPLHQIAHGFSSGFGVGKDNQAKSSDGIIQIRPTNINSYGDLIFERNIYLPQEHIEKYEMTSYGDVLFNNTNSQDLVGKTAIFLDKDNEYFYSNHISVIKTNVLSLNPDYLKSVLNLYQEHKYFYSTCTNWNNQSGVGNERLKAVKIPIPPIEKQTEIATHIAQIRTQAKQLQAEAANLLASAKTDIERMILGEVA